MSEPDKDLPQTVVHVLAVDDTEELLANAQAHRESCDPVPIKPGWHNAAAASRAGCEDEYSNRMAFRYGGEW